jgi:acetylornithine deacetylase/succinyl-diaminopimelate desuccinylase-like protein
VRKHEIEAARDIRRNGKTVKVIALATILPVVAVFSCAAQSSNLSPIAVAVKVRQYRRMSEQKIIGELYSLLAIPNTANDEINIQRNAAKLVELLQQRGFQTQLLPISGRGPVVLGRLDTPGATRTVIFYCHYDGQPVEASGWSGTQPFEPALRTGSIEAGGKLIPFPGAATPYKDDWRIYARSASDDKSPIIAILAALDALREEKIPLAVNVKLVLDGEEEAGSPHLEETLIQHKELLAGDLLISCDGPVHQSGRPLMDFGNRGVVAVRITVYGPVRSLHSGHYGNWAPNPAMHLAQLLASMKDASGKVLIDGFYADVAPLGQVEKQAMREAPSYDAELLKQFAVARPEGNGESLLELLAEPSLNVDGLMSGWIGEQSKTIIPDRAIASLDIRLVKNVEPERQVDRLIAHIRKQRYTVFTREPTVEERTKFPQIAQVTHDKGYPAASTRMDLPVSVALASIVDEAAGEPSVKLPVLGGSIPMYIFERLNLPVIGVPIVNFDNNQHTPDENLRLGNLWRGMEIYGAVLADLRW